MTSQFSSRRRIRRVGLISPTSGNLGNATMQSAMIANLRKRIVGVEIVGITLNADDTRRRHGIEAFPLSAVSRPSYGLLNSGASHAHNQLALRLSPIKQWLKHVPLLGRMLRTVRNWCMELAHIATAVRVVRKLDRVIVPGGGAVGDFWGGPWGHPWTLFKWSMISRVCGVPFLFVSVGQSPLERPLSRFFLSVALRLAEYRSYRDHGSKNAAETLIGARNDPVYPDLAFSYARPEVQTLCGNGSQDRRLVIGVSPIAYCDPRTWPRKDGRRYAAYVTKLAEMVKWLIKERHRVLFFTTDGPDALTLDDVQTIIRAGDLAADAVRILPGSTEQSPESLLKGISCADLTIASRLHGVILSHLNTTPVLALSFEPKVDAHMSAVGHKDYCLSIDNLRLDTLIERFTALKAARQQERAHLRCAAVRFRDLLDVQYDRIVGATQSGPVRGRSKSGIDDFRSSCAASSQNG